MSTHLRIGIDTLKKYYINKLIHSGLDKDFKTELDSLTLSELKLILKNQIPNQK
ncbi:Fur-regulated basic protein FbpA [Neobacillus cucumis]|uniref:Fur-regulated basic protein FbpA n=1 Tax=Bacillaceae TaxID=186817 RepID=UPI0018DFD9F0|nr:MULTISPECIES: Fur-regulated basic protein FbpA [Bacillaceae]MBI0578827.1 Fur-regulated basic protein FbpA [Neobacillus cucumis]MED1471322.1 Fur-regulated basic protein FbpA [Bacillus salipaludis]WHY92622.1 Fur-regulated basic protein FbpA [Neobacillus cucumis]